MTSARSTPAAAATTTVRPSITCIVPAFNEAEGITGFINGLCAHLAALTEHYDVIVVDDGSRDGTGFEVIGASGGLPVRLLSLSRNFGKEAAISAGLDASTGEVVVIIDADFQQPFHVIDEFIRQWQQGYDMVYGLRTSRSTDPPVRRFLSRVFYRLLSRCSSVEIPPDAGDFRLMDRAVVDALLRLPERNRFMKGLYAWVGFDAVAVPYTPAPRLYGHSHFNPLRLIGLSLDGLTAFTTWPLRAVSAAGSVLALLAFVYGAYLMLSYILYGHLVSGWTTIVVSLMLFAGIQLISLGVVGEYVGRIFEEVKARPLYVVKRELGRGLKATPQ